MITDRNHYREFETIFFQHGIPCTGDDVTAAFVGPQGGTIRVSDPCSLLHGTTLRIPPGALDTLTLIQIEEGEHNCPFGLGPSVKIKPEGLVFNFPVELEMRIRHPAYLSEDIEPSFYIYDETNTDWVEAENRPHASGLGVLRCNISRL